jgi:ABC-type transport auxiliary lipoprotein component
MRWSRWEPYIAHRNSPYELELSDTARWDASPVDIVRRAARDSLSSSGVFAAVVISSATLPGFYRCEVDLRRFERFDKGNESFGELNLKITFLSLGGRILYRNSLSKETKLPDRSFTSLALFLSEALYQGLDEARGVIIKSLP